SGPTATECRPTPKNASGPPSAPPSLRTGVKVQSRGTSAPRLSTIVTPAESLRSTTGPGDDPAPQAPTSHATSTTTIHLAISIAHLQPDLDIGCVPPPASRKSASAKPMADARVCDPDHDAAAEAARDAASASRFRSDRRSNSR